MRTRRPQQPGKQMRTRIFNCLRENNIRTVGDLVQKREMDLLRLKNFGMTSLKEIHRVLAKHGLSLWMPKTGARRYTQPVRSLWS